MAARQRRRVRPLAVVENLEPRTLLSQGAGPGWVQAQAQAQAHPAIVRAEGHRAHGAGHAQAPATGRWGWLANSYWYVPAPNTPALLFETTSQTLIPVLDQTVFHITGYRSGYFWGVSVTQLGSGSPVSSSMIGSVTPEGRVLLNFTPMDGSSSATVTEGIGQMRLKLGRWTMENQMFTGASSSSQLGHWAYMVQTHPGRPGWQSLPVAGVSVPQFLSTAGGSGPQPIGG